MLTVCDAGLSVVIHYRAARGGSTGSRRAWERRSPRHLEGTGGSTGRLLEGLALNEHEQQHDGADDGERGHDGAPFIIRSRSRGPIWCMSYTAASNSARRSRSS